MIRKRYIGGLLFAAVIAIAILKGCAPVKLDKSIRHIENAKPEAALVSLRQELVELEKKEQGLKNARNYSKKYNNVKRVYSKT